MLLRPIPGFPGYFASNAGHIYSTKQKVQRKMTPCTKRSKTESNQHHYLKIILLTNGKRTTRVVHRLVYLAFHGEINKGWHVHHIDNNPLNNRIENLVQLHPLEHKRLHDEGEENHGKL